MDYDITHLELKFMKAKQMGLIADYEHIMHRDYIVVRFLSETDETTKNQVKTHIRKNYYQVEFVTFGNIPNQDYMYIKYHVSD